MISVLTLTYQRHHLLEEAIESFRRQYSKDDEMVIINDSPDVKYTIDDKNIKIVNLSDRFSSIGKKLEFGYKQCSSDYIYRLDDDDLLLPYALLNVTSAITKQPFYDIYRSSTHLYFCHNEYINKSDSINNGNCYSKKYLDSITFPEKSGDEDVYITFHNNAKIFTIDKPTMAYRWGMNTYHISGMGIKPNSEILDRTDNLIKKESGIIKLNPHFKHEYYQQIK